MKAFVFEMLAGLAVRRKLGTDYQEFLGEITGVNLSRVRAFGAVAVVIFISLVFVDISYYRSGKWELSQGYRLLFYSHLSVLAILSIFILLTCLKPLRQTGRASLFHRWLIAATLFLGMSNFVVISIGDVFINGSVAAYIGVVFSFASIFVMTNGYALLLYAPNLLFMLYLLNFTEKTVRMSLTAQNINVLTFTVVALLLSRMIFYSHARDFQSRKLIDRQQRRLDELSKQDPLTRTLNRRSFAEIASAEIERIRRYGGSLSLAMLDLDDFKMVNDRHGHAVGDRVLVETAEIVGSRIRKTDRLFRWGGEEFVILSPETPMAPMVLMAEKLRRAVADHRFAGELAITASFGVTSYVDGECIETTLQRADAALYGAKNNGRNRVEEKAACG